MLIELSKYQIEKIRESLSCYCSCNCHDRSNCECCKQQKLKDEFEIYHNQILEAEKRNREYRY